MNQIVPMRCFERRLTLPAIPWLLAAELATAKASGKRPAGIRHARAMVEDRDFTRREVSELASEVATLEMTTSEKDAKRLFRSALRDPTENSLAQVEWASHHIAGLVVPSHELAVPLASEARTLHLQEEGDWLEAAKNASAWQSDQLFSANAALAASFVYAAGLDDWQSSFEAAVVGLVAHPTRAMLLNNAAYSLIEMNRLEEAVSLLERIDFRASPDQELISGFATRGLLAFRRGFPESGRRLYEQAIELARAMRQRPQEAMALVMLAREELSVDIEASRRALTRGERVAAGVRSKAVERWLSRVRTDVDRASSAGVSP